MKIKRGKMRKNMKKLVERYQEKNGLTRAGAAESFNISGNELSKMIYGTRINLYNGVVNSMCHVLKCDPAQILTKKDLDEYYGKKSKEEKQ